MTYATTADIEAEIKGSWVFSASSAVTSTAVVEFLTQADAEINMYLGDRYATPIVAVESLLIVKKIETDLVVYRVGKILNLKNNKTPPDKEVEQDIPTASAYREAMKLLKAIAVGKLDLPDETKLDTSPGLASFHTDVGNSAIVPCFQKGVDQW